MGVVMKRMAAAASIVLAGTLPGMAQSCDELWYQRNLIYKEAGYCFKTANAVRSFGNAGCRFDNQTDVPLSARDRAEIDSIRSMERTMRCAP